MAFQDYVNKKAKEQSGFEQYVREKKGISDTPQQPRQVNQVANGDALRILANQVVKQQAAATAASMARQQAIQQATVQERQQPLIQAARASAALSLKRASKAVEAATLRGTRAAANAGKGLYEQTARNSLAPYSGMLGSGATRAMERGGLTQGARQLIGLEQRVNGGQAQPWRTRLLDAADAAVAQRGRELAQYADSDAYAAAQRAEADRLRDFMGPMVKDGKVVDTGAAADEAMKRYYEELPYTRDFRTATVGDSMLGQNTMAMMNEFAGRGNVDLFKRPKVSANRMKGFGWGDGGDDVATVYSSTYSAGDRSQGYDFDYGENVVINATPIRDDGYVMSPAILERYIEKLARSGNILEADKPENGGHGLIISVDKVTGSLDEAYDKAGEEMERLHELQAIFYEGDATPVETELMDYMTAEERKTYDYIMMREGKQAALDYLNSMRSELGRRMLEQTAEERYELGQKDPWLAGVARTVDNVVGNIEAGGYVAKKTLDAAGAGLQNIFENGQNYFANRGENVVTGGNSGTLGDFLQPFRNNLDIDPNSRWFSAQVARDYTDKGITSNMSPIGSFIYQSAMSGGVDSMLNSVLFGGAGIGMMGMGVMAGGVKDVLDRGGTQEQALLMGTVEGLAEIITENMGSEAMAKKLINGTPNVVKTILRGMLGESIEEGTSEIIDFLADNLVMADKSELNRRVEELVNSGMSRTDANKAAIKEEIIKIGESMAGGAVGALFMGGMGGAARAFDRTAQTVATRDIEKLAKDYKGKAADVFINAWDGQTPPMEYKAAFDALWKSGQTGIGLEETQKAGNEVVGKLSPGQQYGIWQAGANEAANAQQEAESEVVDPISGERIAEAPAAQASQAQATQPENVALEATNQQAAPAREADPMSAEEQALIESRREKLAGARQAAQRYKESVARGEVKGQADIDAMPDVSGRTDAERFNPVTVKGGVVKNYMARRLDYRQGMNIRALDRLGKRLGIEFEIVDSIKAGEGQANASYAGGRRFLVALNATENAYLQAGAHELVHYVKDYDADGYRAMERIVVDALGRDATFDIEAQISQRQEEYANAGQQLTREQALEEIVAEAVPTVFSDQKVIEQLVMEDRTLAEKIGDWLHEFIEKVTKALRESVADYAVSQSREEIASLYNQAEALREIAKAFDSALERAGENAAARETEQEQSQSAQTEETEKAASLKANNRQQLEKTLPGVQLSEGDKAAYYDPRYSLRSFRDSDYHTNRKETARLLAKAVGVDVKDAERYIRNLESIAAMIARDPERLDYEAEDLYSALKDNAEYKFTVDFSTLCKKRLLYTGTFDKIQAAMPNGILTENDVIEIRNMMAEKGYEVACAFCYVESRRKKNGQIIEEFLKKYRAAAKGDGWMELGAEGRKKKFHVEDGFEPQVASFNTMEGYTDIIKNHKNVLEAYMYFMNARGTSKPKLIESMTDYRSEILDEFKNQRSVDSMNRRGGLRIQSFSDFQTLNLLDMMQVITDMSRVGLKGQAYTKVPAFGRIFGGTGLKINLSLVAKGVDARGNIIFDDVEGMPHEEAFAIRKKHSKNVGTILVAGNDAVVRAAMKDPRIDFIIPYHRSGWSRKNEKQLGLDTYENYTKYQNETLTSTGKKNPDAIYPSDYWDYDLTGDQNAEKYLALCKERGLKPKFPQFAGESGYWKMLIDFKMYDNDGVKAPQMPVKPEFDMREAMKRMREYDGSEGTLPVAEDIVEEFKARHPEKFVENQARFSLKSAQFELIQRTNPMTDDYHLGIRAESDIKTAEEALGTRNDDEWYVYPDWKWEDGQRALQSGRVTLYSSHQIEEGTFVSPSRMMASDYAGDGEIYSKRVSVNDVAWINADEGQYAPVSDQPGVRFALKNTSKEPVATDKVLGGVGGRPAIKVQGTQQTDEMKARGETKAEELKRLKGTPKAAEGPARAQRERYEAQLEQQVQLEATKAQAQAMQTAKSILKEYESQYDRGALRDNLVALQEEIGKNGASDRTLTEATQLAREIIEKSAHVDTSLREQYKDLRKTLRETPVKLTETQKAEAANIAGSYGAFRQSVFGTFNLSDNGGKSLDAIWDEWSQIAPQLFTPHMNEGDMVQRLADIRAAFMPKVSNPYGEDMDGASVDLGLRLQEAAMQALGDDAGAKDMARAVDELRKQYQDAMRDERMRVKLEQRAAFDRIAEALREARNNEDEGAARAAMEAYRGQMKRIGAEAAEAQARLAYRLHYEDRTARAAAVKRITQNREALMKMLAKPDKKKHIPIEMQGPVLEVLNGIDITRDGKATEGSEMWKQSLKKIGDMLARQMDRQEHGGDTQGVWMTIRPEMVESFQEAADVVARSRKPMGQMTLNEIMNLSQALATVRHCINSANELFANSRYKDINDLAGQSISEMKKLKTNAAQGIEGLDTADRLLNVDSLDAGSFMERLGSAATSVFDELHEGMDRGFSVARKASEDIPKILGLEGKDKKKREKELNAWANDKRKITLHRGAQEAEVTVTTRNLMELYAWARREQTRMHLLSGGWQPKPKKIGKLQAVSEKMQGEKLAELLNDTPVYQMSEDDLKRLVGDYEHETGTESENTGMLTLEQKKMTRAMQDYLSGPMAQLGNEVSMKMWDFMMFNEPNYWPGKTASEFRNTKEQDGTVLFNAQTNKGFTKQTQEVAKNPLVLGDAIDTFLGHIGDMANFYGYAMPVDDLLKWYNYSERDENGSLTWDGNMKKEIKRIAGQPGIEFIQHLLDDLNGGMNRGNFSSALEKIVGKAGSRYKSSSIAAKFRVAVQQPTAVARAAAFMDRRDVLAASAKMAPNYATMGKFAKNKIEEMQAHSPLAWWKAQGNYEIGTGASMYTILTGMHRTGREAFNERLMWLAGRMDDLGWLTIWEASEMEVKRKNKGIQVGSEEYFDKVRERFEDVCMKTQVVDTILTRTESMRNRNPLVKNLTAFQSEPLKNYNLLRNGISELRRAKQTGDQAAMKQAGKRIRRSVEAIVVSQALNAVVTALYDTIKWRDPDKDEDTFLEQFWKRFWGDYEGLTTGQAIGKALIGKGGDFLQNINPLAWITFVKDIVSVIGGDDVDRTELSAPARLVKDVQNLFGYLGDNKKGYTAWGAIKPFLKDMSQATGSPVSGLIDDTEIILNALSLATGGKVGSMKTRERAATMAGAVEELYEAVTAGDTAKAARLRANMEKGQFGQDPMSPKDIDTKLAKMLAREDERVAQAWEAAQDIDGGSAKTRLRNDLMKDGWSKETADYAIDHYDEIMTGDAKAALKKAKADGDEEAAEGWRDVLRDFGWDEEKIAKAEAEKDLEEALESPKATVKELYQMIRAGEAAEASAIRGRLIAEGKSKEDVSKGLADMLATYDQRIETLWQKRNTGHALKAADYQAIQKDGFTDEEVKRAVNQYPSIVKSEVKALYLQAMADGDARAAAGYKQRLLDVGTKEETIDGWAVGKDLDAELDEQKMYTNANLWASIRGDDTTDADILDIRDYMLSQSKAADPEASLRSSMTSEFKDEYVDLMVSGRTREAERLKTRLVLAGAKEETINGWVQSAKKDEYIELVNAGKTQEAEKLRSAMISAGGKADTIDNWVPAAQKADATDALKAAIDKGDARAAEREVDRIRDEEIMDVSAIVTRLNSAYKQKYFDLLDAGREREADELADMLAGLGLRKKNGDNYYAGSWWNEQYRDYLKKKDEDE